MFSIKDKLNLNLNLNRSDDDPLWSVILVLPSLSMKDSLVSILVGAFHVTDDFASQLLVNTPVILLDEMTQDDAGRVRDYFLQNGAEACITQNREVKKVCYRIKWRHPPALDFLAAFRSPKDGPKADKNALEQTLQEKEARLRQLEADRLLEKRVADEKVSQVMRELEEWKNKGTALRRDVEVLTASRDNLQKALTQCQAKMGQPAANATPQAPQEAPGSGLETANLRQEIQTLTADKNRLESALTSARAELEEIEKKNRTYAEEKEKLEHAAMSAHDDRRSALEAVEGLKLQMQSMASDLEELEECRDSFEKAFAQAQASQEWTRKMASVLQSDREGLEKSLLEIRRLYDALLKDAGSWHEKAQALSNEQVLNSLDESLLAQASPELQKALREASEQYQRLETECRLVRQYFEKKFQEVLKNSPPSGH